jgi:hypothetical protein
MSDELTQGQIELLKALGARQLEVTTLRRQLAWRDALVRQDRRPRKIVAEYRSRQARESERHL